MGSAPSRAAWCLPEGLRAEDQAAQLAMLYPHTWGSEVPADTRVSSGRNPVSPRAAVPRV